MASHGRLYWENQFLKGQIRRGLRDLLSTLTFWQRVRFVFTGRIGVGRRRKKR